MDTDLVASSSGNLIYLYTLGAITILLIFEGLLPRRTTQQGMAWRWTNNFVLALISRYINQLVSVAFIILLSRWTEIRQIGLFQSYSVHPAVAFFTLVLVSQFFSYWVHRAFHHFAWLWPIHAVHHSDTEIDVTTGYRHHPVEPLISLPVIAPLILMLGIPANVGLAFKLFEIGATLLSHANIRIPEPLERYLRYLILTPDFHRLHHCSDPRFTNSNYGSLVPWFDYVFRTASARPYEDQAHMQLGLEYLREPADNRLDHMLAIPLRVRGLQRNAKKQH